MPLRLIVMRHAKSSWDSGANDDHARPLDSRGRRDAPRIAAALQARGWTPDQVLSSTATRTRQTWAAMAPVLGPDTPAIWTRSLYIAGPSALWASLADCPAEARCVLALGHNPGWEDLVARLSGAHHVFTTANAALLEAPEGARWSSLPLDGWRLEALLRPKEL
ncbi:MAG: histidine phosphatase family protein [Alphaproteobacteria bacterium]|nr:histidine phosphatase family protein [Alphaproteobacteria bacterium]MCB9796589.1 histidine phosphatase family protein [Alphaproteobacteria bacterium]